MENSFQALIQPGTWARSFAAASDQSVIWCSGPNSLLQNMHMVVSTLRLSPALGWSVLLSCFSGWTQRVKEVHNETQISALPGRSTTVLDASASTRPALDMPEGKHLSSCRRRKKNPTWWLLGEQYWSSLWIKMNMIQKWFILTTQTQ